MSTLDTIISRYEKGEGLKKIADSYKMTPLTLKEVLSKSGVELNVSTRRTKLPVPERSTLIAHYRRLGTLTKIGRIFETDAGTVARWFRLHKIPYKGKAQQTSDEWLEFLKND